MDHDERYFALQKGMHVVGADGQDIGTINLVEHAYIIVQKGIFPQDYYIPLSAIASHDDKTVYLDITKDEALDRGLGNPMVAFTDTGVDAPTTDTSTETTMSAGMASRDETLPLTGAAESLPSSGMVVEDTDEAINAADEATRDDDAHRTIALHEEELTATTRPVERGAVHIRKNVIEEKQTFEVPVVEDEVIVTRRRVDLDPDESRELFTEERLEIPLRGQEVEIETRAHVVEEVEIDKAAHQRIEQVTETVRHEEARIEGDDADLPGEREDSRPAT